LIIVTPHFPPSVTTILKTFSQLGNVTGQISYNHQETMFPLQKYRKTQSALSHVTHTVFNVASVENCFSFHQDCKSGNQSRLKHLTDFTLKEDEFLENASLNCQTAQQLGGPWGCGALASHADPEAPTCGSLPWWGNILCLTYPVKSTEASILHLVVRSA
jgi:hypothetical protein